MDDTLQKYIALVPLSLNDGTPVEAETILEFKEQLLLLADGWSVPGTVEGAYRMADGRTQIDHTLQFWIWIREGQYAELRRVVSELGAKLGQEKMYLERTFADLDLVDPPNNRTEENP